MQKYVKVTNNQFDIVSEFTLLRPTDKAVPKFVRFILCKDYLLRLREIWGLNSGQEDIRNINVWWKYSDVDYYLAETEEEATRGSFEELEAKEDELWDIVDLGYVELYPFDGYLTVTFEGSDNEQPLLNAGLGYIDELLEEINRS